MYDTVAAIRHPRLNARKSRLLITPSSPGTSPSPSTPGTVVVFLTAEAPAFTATIASRPTPQSLVLDDGTTLSFRPVGSSCQWPLAKCRVSTQTLITRYHASLDAAPAPTPAPVDTQESIDPDHVLNDLSDEELEALTAPDDPDTQP